MPEGGGATAPARNEDLCPMVHLLRD